MKHTKVNVYNSAVDYIVTVSVYRHVSSPEEISVHIQSVYPIPPKEPEEPSDEVCQLVPAGGEPKVFDPALYPPKSHF